MKPEQRDFVQSRQHALVDNVEEEGGLSLIHI